VLQKSGRIIIIGTFSVAHRCRPTHNPTLPPHPHTLGFGFLRLHFNIALIFTGEVSRSRVLFHSKKDFPIQLPANSGKSAPACAETVPYCGRRMRRGMGMEVSKGMWRVRETLPK